MTLKTGSRVLITGGGDGIGYFMAKQLLEDGHRVAVLDIETGKAEALGVQFGEALLAFKGDVTIAEDVSECVAAMTKRWDGVDIAVHNACLCLFRNFDDTTDEDFARTFGVNYYGAVNVLRTVLPIMRAQKSGRVCFTSSGVGVTGFGGLTAYASTKGALEAMAKCIGIEEAASGITLHILHPPLTRTVSSSPLPVPAEFMADPEKVGRGLAKNLGKKSFIICHSGGQRLQTSMAYRFPIGLGKLMSKMAGRAQQDGE